MHIQKVILIVVFFGGVLTSRAQGLDWGAGGGWAGGFYNIPHSDEWATGIMTASNLYINTLNVIYFKNNKKRSNAGFLFLSGLFQYYVGAVYNERGDLKRPINMTVGATTAIFSAVRLFYRPKRETGAVYLSPYYVPVKDGYAAGINFRVKL